MLVTAQASEENNNFEPLNSGWQATCLWIAEQMLMYQTIRHLAITFQAGVTQHGVQIHGSISKKWLVNLRWQPCHFLMDEARVYGTVKAMNHFEFFPPRFMVLLNPGPGPNKSHSITVYTEMQHWMTHEGTGSEGQLLNVALRLQISEKFKELCHALIK